MARAVRRIGRSFPLIAPVCVALLCAAPIAAQTAGEYRALVERYATSDDPNTMAALARWSRPAVTDAVNFWTSTLTSQELITAPVLHTELASTLIDHTPALASFHMGTARRLLDALSAGDRRNERALPSSVAGTSSSSACTCHGRC